MTCVECKFQWCWLCEQQYNTDHYKVGKCRGLQFYSERINEPPLQRSSPCSRYLFYPSYDSCGDSCLDSCFYHVDIADICKMVKCCQYLFLFVFCFFGIVPTLTIMLYMDYTNYSDKLERHRKFLNVMTLLFAIVNFIYLQLFATCLSIAYCVVTVFYPPVNTLKIMYDVVEDKL